MPPKIEWLTKKVKIKDLKDYEHNPRKMSKKDFERLVNDIKHDGYHNRLLVNLDFTIIGGHSRRKALLAAGYAPDDEIEVLQSSRLLDQQEYKKINIKDNLPFGEYDFDILANHFDVPALLEWGMAPEWFVGQDEPEPFPIEPDPTKDKCKQCGRAL